LKTPIANMIADMHGKGIPVELIVSAVATLEEAMAARAVSTGQENVHPVDTSTIDKRRAWDRERKRRKRMSANSTGCPPVSTGHSTGFHRIPPDVDSILSSKEGASNKEVKEKKESKRIARGTRIPPDFSIDDDDRKFAASLGIPPDTVESETPQFIDYWSSVSGSKGVKLNWKATWRNRMRDLKKYMPTTSRGNVRVTSEFQRSRNETKDILNDLDNFAAGSRSGGEANTRLLPGNSGERSEGVRGGIGGDVIDISAAGYRSRG
jgi:Ni/Co efflux regulator RcnB